MGSPFFVKIDGEYLDRLGLGYSDPTYSTTFGQAGGGGCEEAEFVLSAPIGYRSHLLREGAPMEVLLGSYPVFSGTIDGVDRDTWTIHAQGLAKHASTCLALDNLGQTTTVADIAIIQGAIRGMLPGWGLSESISGVAYGAAATTDAPNYLDTLIDGVAQAAGKWWGVGADRVVRLSSLPATPKYHLVPQSVDLPVSYEEYASTVQMRYYDSTSHVATTATSSDPVALAAYPKEVAVDALALGEISSSEAQAHADGIIAQGKSRPGYTASVEVSKWKLLNDNLGPADIRRVTAGEMVRLHGVSNDLTREGYHDFVIGRAKVSPAEGTLLIDPMGLVSNGSQEDIIAKVLGAAWDQKFQA